MIAYGYRQCSSNLQTPKRVKSIPTSDSEHLSLASTHKSPKALTFEHSMRGTELRRDSSADFGHKVGGNASSSNSSIRYISDKVNLARAEFSCRLQDQKRESERESVCVCEDKRKTQVNTSIDYAEQQSFCPISSTRICLTSSFKIEDPLHSTRNTTSLFFHITCSKSFQTSTIHTSTTLLQTLNIIFKPSRAVPLLVSDHGLCQ